MAAAAVDGAPSPVGAWVRTVFGVILVVGMTQWPYTHACGLPLGGYLIAVAMVLVTGAWAGLATWRARTGLAHVVALAVFLVGTLFATAQVLPRLEGGSPDVAWLCSR